jgi:uncharacterized protein YecT (DUF1311 family)
MRLILSLVLLLPLLTQSATADDEYAACTGAAGAVMPDLGECGGAWLDREDARLNVAWKNLILAVDNNQKEIMLDEQRSWLSYRDKTCVIYSDELQFGQNGRYLTYPNCRATVIQQRTQAIKDLIHDIELR